MSDSEMERRLWAEQANLEKEQRELSAERQSLTNRLLQIDRRLRHIDRRVSAIAALVERDAMSPLSRVLDPAALPQISPSAGLTAAIRDLLRANDALKPTTIRDLLERSGFKPGDNLLIMIHGTLKRMEQGGEVRAVRVHGRIAYKRVEEPHDAEPA